MADNFFNKQDPEPKPEPDTGEKVEQAPLKVWDLEPIKNQLYVCDFRPRIHDCKAQYWLSVM